MLWSFLWVGVEVSEFGFHWDRLAGLDSGLLDIWKPKVLFKMAGDYLC